VTGGATGEGSDTLIGIEDADGSSFDDTITGDAGPNEIDGGAGDDTLLGGDGDDLFFDNSGDNDLDGGNGIDIIGFGAGPGVTVDLVSGTASTLRAVHGDQHRVGGRPSFDDIIIGDAGPNLLLAGMATRSRVGRGRHPHRRCRRESPDGGDGIDVVTTPIDPVIADLSSGTASTADGLTRWPTSRTSRAGR
jgi:Ca2+-binding RTX toxin-like protein